MESGITTGAHRGTDGLRERNHPFKSDSTAVSGALAAAGEVEQVETMDAAGHKKTFGRTPDGTGELFLFHLSLFIPQLLRRPHSKVVLT